MNRFGFVLKRLALTVPLLAGIVLVVFLLLEVTPGDPARQIVGLRASQAELDEARDELGLNDPLPNRYVRYVGQVAQGDLGYSYKARESVSAMVSERFEVTLWLLSAASLLALLIAVPVAIRCARHRGGCSIMSPG